MKEFEIIKPFGPSIVKIKMPNETIEGVDLIKEIGFKVKRDFNVKTLPLMLSMIDTICDEKPLKFEWKNFK